MQSNIKHKIYKAMKNIKVNLAILIAVFFINCVSLMAQQTSVNRVMEIDYSVNDASNIASTIFNNNDSFIMEDNTLQSGQISSTRTNKYYSDGYGISIREDQMNTDIPSVKAEVMKLDVDNSNNISVTSVNESSNDKDRTICQSDENEPMKWRREYLWSR